MFREDLSLAKGIFEETANDKSNFKKLPNASEAQAMVKRLVGTTLQSYGDVGLYDPARLATIDFLNQPEKLVELVEQVLFCPTPAPSASPPQRPLILP